MGKRLLWLGLIVAGLLAMMAATRWLTEPPPLRAENGVDQFDAVRAKARLARLLGSEAPHPADSPASDGVRGRLVGELRAMGLRPRVDDRFACNKLHKQSGVSCARVRNVVVTIGNTAATAPHLLINSHYDSVPVGPGASDAGLGVAAMLEAAYLMKDRPLVRPVTFLFNEGEELGLIGARAFLDGDPVSRRVDALINLEARGTSGPVNMFETSIPNRAAVRLFGESVSHPVANSLAVSAYRLIPNYTDVNTFVEERNWLFLNFAPIGNETRYHSPGDDLAAVDLSTLQHMGDQLLEVGTALGAAATPTQARGERLFMNIGTRWLFTWSGGLPTALLYLVLLAGVLIGWLRRVPPVERGAAVRSAGVGVGLLLAALMVPVALAWLGLSVMGAFREGQFWRAYPKATELAVYAGVIASGLALLATGRRVSQERLRACWWGLFLLLGVLLSLAASGALVYFLLPPLAWLLLNRLLRRWEAGGAIASCVAAATLFVTMGGMLGLLHELLNGGPLWIFALLGGLVLMPWLIEARPLLEGISWQRIVPASLALAALAWVPAALVPAYSQDRQQQWTTQYVLGGENGPVWSIVNDRKPLPERFDQFAVWRQGTLPGVGSRQRWIASAPPLPGFLQPRLEALPRARSAGERRLSFRVRTNGADSILLRLTGSGALRAAGFNGQLVRFEPGTKAPYTLSCTGRSCDGAVGELVAGPEPLEVEVIATHWRLPGVAAQLLAARPRWARPQYLPDATVLVRRVRV